MASPQTFKSNSKAASEVASRLLRWLDCNARFAIVLGSGFKDVLEAVDIKAEVAYAKIRGFQRTAVAGHTGRMVFGKLSGCEVVVLAGRAHYYEGHSMEQVTFPMRVLAAMGVRDVLLTNAAGGINRKFKPGDFMRLTDHINFMGANPLRGPTREGESRFPDMSRVYDPQLGKLLDRAAKPLNIKLQKGVYLAVSGPSYETPAEINAFARLGADAVGMSTVPEAIVARACGMRVAGLSCITNLAAGRSRKPPSHDEVLEVGRSSGTKAASLLRAFAAGYANLGAKPTKP